MARDYDHKKIEAKWQTEWEKLGVYTTSDEEAKEKYYVLDMFPYPSGAGLHVGHPKGYIATDVQARRKRMQGFNVLHPMGWDAFGLPAEGYAIKTGTPPQETTDKSIANFKSQISNLSLSYDWSREIATHTPAYYRWTQWLFLKFFEKGLAYKKKALVNWDPVDQTVLANEQVLADGTAERSGAKVEKKELEQWFFKITDYADELVSGLDTVDWPESTKINQRNWIGKSEGLVFTSPVKDTSLTIDTFSTHFEAFYADTFVVIAPDHPLLPSLLEGVPNKSEIFAAAKRMVDERVARGYEEIKEPEGIFTGRYTVDPVGNGDLPIWIANYALADYGTGIVKCSAHDERDYAFAKKYSIPLKEVLEPIFTQRLGSSAFHEGEPVQQHTGVIVLLKHWAEDKYLALSWKEAADWGTLLTGGMSPGMSAADTALKEIKEETGYLHSRITRDLGSVWGKYYHVPKKANRIARANVFLAELLDGEREQVADHEAARHELKWLTIEELRSFLTPETHKYALSKLVTDSPWVDMKNGVLTEPTEFAGKIAAEVRNEIADYAVKKGLARRQTNYRLRDWLISRQRYWGAPIPVVYDPEGKAHAIPEEHLPWLLPTDVEYLPKGTSPLGSSKELLLRTEKIFGAGWRPEIDTMDTFVCSSWYFFRFADAHNEKEFASKDTLKKWLPVDLYVGGAEHTVLHLMYARFFTKALRDMKYLAMDEPFMKLRHVGLVLAEDGRKMSKRWGNVINPDDVVNQFGADSLRTYEMFMGPFEQQVAWSTNGVVGVRRFIERVHRLFEKVGDGSPNLDVITNQTVKKVSEDIDAFKFNTAVSQMMIWSNEAEKGATVSRTHFETFLKLLAPFAPHVTEELWHELGNGGSIHLESWPSYDTSKLVGDMVTIAVQVGGKTRGTVTVKRASTQEEVLAAIMGDQKMAENIPQTPSRVVYVADRVINLIP